MFGLFEQAPAIPAPTPAVPAAAPQPGVNVPPTVVPAVGINTDQNGAVPADLNVLPGAVPAADNANKSPLDAYSDLWETAPIDPNAPQPPTAPTLDPKQLAEKVGTIDFSNTVAPETLAKITAGGEEAGAAFLEAMNTVARNVMLQSTLVGNKLAQKVVGFETEQLQSQVPDLIKQNMVTDNLSSNNPLYSNPAVKPLIDMAKKQIQVKYPNATASELTAMAENYVGTVVAELTPKSPDSAAPVADDWTKFLEGSQQGPIF